MISRDVYLIPVLNNAPRLLGLLNRNMSSSNYGCFDREYWHYNTVDFACARKQEAVLTLTLLYLTDHKENRYYQSGEILDHIKAALIFWTKIQNRNGSFNEWYPNEHSFVVTSFSTYAVSESLLLIKDELHSEEYEKIMAALKKAGDWLSGRHEMRVMNQQTGAAIALLNLHALTGENKYLNASKEKISLLKQRQSSEGWFLEYGGPDIGYLSLAIDYLCKYYQKTEDPDVGEIIDRSLGFIKYFIQPNLVAGGEYTSRNTEYLIPHGFEIFSNQSEDAKFMASVIRKSLLDIGAFPNYFDDRYLTYVGYTWLQAYQNANEALDESVDKYLNSNFNKEFREYFKESGLLVINDSSKHLIINVKKGGAFRLFDKKVQRAYSDSGVLVNSEGKWYTSGWLADNCSEMDGNNVTVSGNMWKVPDKSMTPLSNILLRVFQLTFGRVSFISLWMKERLRDLLITKTKPSKMRYNRILHYNIESSTSLLDIRDTVLSEKDDISSFSVFAKDTCIYVPSSRYYVDQKDSPFQVNYPRPVSNADVSWKINRDSGVEFRTDN